MNHPRFLVYALGLTLLLTQLPAFSGQLSLVQSPPGAAREPAPNIIVSVDDSGSMGATGIATLRAALTATFGIGSSVADDRIRLAWQSMNRCPQIGASTVACGNYNGMRSLSGTHRTNFDAWARSLTEGGGTPSHLMLSNAGDYLMAPIGTNNASPWAAVPGTTLNPVLSCRKNYHIFMTDGGWNSGTSSTSQHVDTAATNNGPRIVRGGNADNTNKALTATMTYSVTSDQTRLYRDAWGGATTNPATGAADNLSTLSDLAFYYWATDLQPTLTDNVRSVMDRTTTEIFTATDGSGASTALTPFWNPRNNPATWQSMVNYTIGFNTAAAWTGSPTWGGNTFSGDLPNLITGRVGWPSPFCGTGNNQGCDGATNYSARTDSRQVELWHAALNSRGRFVPAPNAAALVTAFQGILDDILTQTASPLVSVASSSSRLRADGAAYVAGFNTAGWSGELGSYGITKGTNEVATTPTWTASSWFNSASFSVSNRPVFTSASGSTGTTFDWNNLSTSQKSALQGSDSATVGQNRVTYLRGDRSQEGSSMRTRNSRLGDIVNSNIWFSGRPLRMSYEHSGHPAFRSSQINRTPTLFVGANDGMLHAFNASTGQERFAYVPVGVYSNLREYTLPNYSHRYFVDGNPFTGDADLSYTTGTSTTPSWRTVLVSGLGAGARGYFALNVTTPTAFTSTMVLLDKSFPASTTNTGTDLDDIGHIYAQPVIELGSERLSEQIVKLNNQRWAVVMGNGVNSYNERPVLLIQYLDGSKTLLKIVANSTTGQSNGLSAPRLVDVNGDGKMDFAYAGDLKGNLWKFNLTSTSDTDWGVSNWSGSTPCKNTTTCSPLYIAKDGSNNRQPITVAPLWKRHPLGGIQVLFGTGINVTDSDRTNTSTQSIYSVWDVSQYSATSTTVTSTDTRNIAIADSRNVLVQQTVLSAVTSTASGSTVTTSFANTSSNTVTYSLSVTNSKRGWFMDMPTSRERVLSSPLAFEGEKVIINSQSPKTGSDGETCDFDISTERNWIRVLNVFTGRPATTAVFQSSDTTMDLSMATQVEISSGQYLSLYRNDGGLDLISFKNQTSGQNSSGSTPPLETSSTRLTTGNGPGLRSDWRQVR
ncbi:pilus assembly protein [Hydrogenophaga sp.]|uniref:pilus assembly protein n=1 Tax=Hydrogenophaga sp. TaxID=1904254 RepID=UPI0035684A3B